MLAINKLLFRKQMLIVFTYLLNNLQHYAVMKQLSIKICKVNTYKQYCTICDVLNEYELKYTK